MTLDLTLMTFLVVLGYTALNLKNLYSATIVLGAYSLVMCLVWTRLNAVDVAFTEAAVGAGISTVFMLAAIHRTKQEEE